MVDTLDQSVGQVFEALGDAGMLENTVIAFSSDNGGAPGAITTLAVTTGHCGERKARSGKEAPGRPLSFGVRCLLLDAGKMAHCYGSLADVANFADVFSTDGYSVRRQNTYSRGAVHTLGKLDGYDMWQNLCYGLGSPRVEMLYNIDYKFLNNAALRLWRYKLVLDGTGFMSERYPRPGGSRPSRDLDKLLHQSTAAKSCVAFTKDTG
ncbi:hypothetical protein HPB49_012234 [Dermacentor silvarum]|uniref:Uncharacterized protein n=1 Tax=Dermacentor silvarum TaxID=543639 RepID=A0ACB8DCX6_DERSI|nr:hypothetical protein HPB49_012234 [Dermacentor silvarum]